MAEHGMQGGLSDLQITDVKAICTAPDGIRLVVVKVETNEPWGCTAWVARRSPSGPSPSWRPWMTTSGRFCWAAIPLTSRTSIRRAISVATGAAVPS